METEMFWLAQMRLQCYSKNIFFQQHFWRMLMLSSSFKCDQIYKCQSLWFWSHFVVLLKYNLGVRQTRHNNLFRTLDLKICSWLLDHRAAPVCKAF